MFRVVPEALGRALRPKGGGRQARRATSFASQPQLWDRECFLATFCLFLRFPSSVFSEGLLRLPSAIRRFSEAQQPLSRPWQNRLPKDTVLTRNNDRYDGRLSWEVGCLLDYPSR